ncbi:hypothetical protein [Gordonia sp. CPCC 205333]|uniref:hypothetical protein n=1 Tax=Gordonia sp. CPCC 205333 TaxID=3140790 RepID=UPI003AF37D8F
MVSVVDEYRNTQLAVFAERFEIEAECEYCIAFDLGARRPADRGWPGLTDHRYLPGDTGDGESAS